ncbi:hypothetical protein B0H66DRAFT_114538 [Apodospora peruviana]|uniref:Uncharacterized protein n=1 Tax=Apodospora peruviana TaxID=516989 RepID=A0AAE0IHM3_9PEZI|nr:hypothetical protein B0H66DRAFT_114538 [Apodospora peruviana]
MRTDMILHLGLLFCLGAAAAPTSSHNNDMQHPLLTENKNTIIIESSNHKQILVPGHNDAFYGPIPKAQQIFDIEFLEIAPSPILVNKYFFILLRGEIPPSTRQKLHLEPSDVANATLSITLSAVLEEGNRKQEARTYTIPLRTAELAEEAHLGIRNATGAYVDYLTLKGRNDILTDNWIPGPFVETGTWTFEIVASLTKDKNEVCLFALTLTQWLEGDGGW